MLLLAVAIVLLAMRLPKRDWILPRNYTGTIGLGRGDTFEQGERVICGPAIITMRKGAIV